MILDYTLLMIFAFLFFIIIYLSFYLFVKKNEMNEIKDSKQYKSTIIRKSHYNIGFLKALNFLNIIYLIAPFLGLLGTVNRILILFKDNKVLSQDSDSFQYLVLHLGHALEITVYGLVTAILSLSLYVYYKNEYNLIWELIEDEEK